MPTVVRLLISSLCPLVISALSCFAVAAENPSAAAKIKVTPESYIRAEVDGRMAVIQKRAGDSVNAFYLIRRPTPTDEQPVVRMNRDTLYGGAVVDTEGGAWVHVPAMPDDRYFSLFIIDNDHYVVDVITEPGKHKIPEGTTKYVFAIPRLQVVNPGDEDELKMLNRLLDQFQVEATSADKFESPNWDWTSMFALRAEYEKAFIGFQQYPGDWMDVKGKANEKTRHIAAAGAWGLFPETEAVYINYTGPNDTGPNYTRPNDTGPQDSSQCYAGTYDVPPNEAFWSITVYGSDAFMKGDNVTISDRTARFNADGTFTVHYGSQAACGDVANRIDITPGWNFLMRVYRPDQSILDRTYTLPAVQPASVAPSASSVSVAHPSDFGVSELAYRVSESNVYFQKHLHKAGVNEFAHQRDIVTVTTQQVIRENQDVLYSSAVVDASEGATISVPEYPAYSIIQVIDMQNYSIGTLYPGESLTLGKDDLSYGDHVYLNARTQLTSNDEAGLQAAHRQQEALLIEANSANAYVTPDLVIADEKLLAVRTALIRDVAQGKVKDYTTLMGTKDFVDPQGHLYATAYGWGGLPIYDAGYIVIPVKAEQGECASLTLDPPPLNYQKGGFWSVTTYDQKGWIARDKAAISNRETKANADGTVTLRFNCDGMTHNLNTVQPFAALLRLYVPQSLEQIAQYLQQAKQRGVIAPVHQN